VATYETTLTIPAPIEKTFAFVSDFRNAAQWDPRTYAAEKTTEGPIGVGTRFILTGGVLRGELLERLHLPESVVGSVLPYDVVAFEPPTVFVLAGENAMVRYRDRLTFSEHEGSTQLVYFAELTLKGRLGFVDRLLQRMFIRIGDAATADLASVVTDGI
jgi:dehydrogenase/reductase SDR family protein 12